MVAGPQNRGGRVLIIKKSGIKYHYTHIYTASSFENGDLSRRVPRKVHINTASKDREKPFQKKVAQILVADKQQQQQHARNKFTIISLDNHSSLL